MTETIKIDGRALSGALLDGVAGRVGACKEAGVEPCLAVVLVGEDPASQVYVRNKGRKAAAVGIETRDHKLPVTTTTQELLALVKGLNEDSKVDGILVQLPLPKGCDEEAVLLAINPLKDVDGFHPSNLGRLMIGNPAFVPCTPQGCMLLLESTGVDLNGAKALVVGRSNIVGKPMASLLTHAHATVTVAHSRTRELEAELASADVVIAAVGRAKFIKGHSLKPGAVVIDVGINRNGQGKLCGDVDFDSVQGIARAITPVPGGVGPMTIACLMQNVVISAERRAGLA